LASLEGDQFASTQGVDMHAQTDTPTNAQVDTHAYTCAHAALTQALCVRHAHYSTPQQKASIQANSVNLA